MKEDTADRLSIIGHRYALALFELGEKYNLLDAFNSDMVTIYSVFKDSQDLNNFLHHPSIPLIAKKEVLETIFKGSVNEYVLNLLKILTDRNRLFVFSSIFSQYVKILNKKRNIMTAEVITAVEISFDMKAKVQEVLSRILNKKINIDCKVQPEIIAGMIIKAEDRIIDGSIKTKLENMKKQLV